MIKKVAGLVKQRITNESKYKLRYFGLGRFKKQKIVKKIKGKNKVSIPKLLVKNNTGSKPTKIEETKDARSFSVTL